MFSYAAATLIVGVAILGTWAYEMSLDYRTATADNGRGLTAPGGRAAGEATPPEQECAGRITGTADCRWADPKDALSATAAVSLGRKFALASGLMEITYHSGAKVVLQGPCTFEVESPRGGFLSLGKLTARVQGVKPQAANPKSQIPNPQFVVRTPTAIVTDLGTEFGVEVTAEGDTDAEVFEGAIRVAAAEDGDDASRQRVCRRGKAVRVGAGKSNLRTIAPREKRANSFVRAIPSQKAVDSQAYAELVLSLRPAVYYRMEQPSSEKDRFVVFDSAPGGHHGELRLDNEYGGSPYRPGRFGEGLWLRGPEAADHVIVHDYPKTTNDRLTVSAWVMATGRPGWAMIAANWGIARNGRSDVGQFLLALYRQDGDLCARVTQRSGPSAEVREGGSQPLPMFVWQHVALVIDGTAAHLYRNGKEVDSRPCAGISPQPRVAGLGIGCWMNEDGSGSASDSPPGYDYWQGWIDELAIFNQVLSAEQIGQLYLGKPARDRRADTETGKGDEPMNGP